MAQQLGNVLFWPHHFPKAPEWGTRGADNGLCSALARSDRGEDTAQGQGRALTSCSFVLCASGSTRPTLLSPSGFVLMLFPLGAGEGSGAALGSGFSSAGAGGFFSGAGLGAGLCSGARRLLAGEGWRSGGAAGSGGAGARGTAAGGWWRGEPLAGCFGAGIGTGAGSARLPSSSRCVWQFRHSHSFFCKARKGRAPLATGDPAPTGRPVLQGSAEMDLLDASKTKDFQQSARHGVSLAEHWRPVLCPL